MRLIRITLFLAIILVQQRYLLKDKIAGIEDHLMIYELAERALDESMSSKLKEYISHVVRASIAILKKVMWM